MRDFKKYEIWKLSHQLVLNIYDLTRELAHSERYQIVSQMQRAAYSIPSNFSEAVEESQIKNLIDLFKFLWGSLMKLNILYSCVLI